MLGRFRKNLAKSLYRMRCNGILKTPPLPLRDGPVVLASMVSHVDLVMYLVAVKSIYRWLDGGRIVLLDDGSLTAEDRGILAAHLGNPKILAISEIDTGACPRGGCWERLLMIADLAAHNYVIQVDSDLLALAEIPEVRDAVRRGRSFVLGTQMGQAVIDLASAADVVQASTSTHVQIVAEKNLPNLGYEGRHYVRGCAGFSGFAPGSLARPEIERFSQDMTALIGSKWSEWGSEQVTSNYLVANSSDPVVLPYPKYANFHPAADLSRTHFFHFMGSHRFQAGRYVQLSRQAIGDMTRA